MPTLFSSGPSADLMLSASSSAAVNLSGFSGWVVTLRERQGPIGVGFLIFLDNVFPPIPSELVLPLVDVVGVHRTVRWFDKHGDKAVFFGRMVPIFRSLISIPAG